MPVKRIGAKNREALYDLAEVTQWRLSRHPQHGAHPCEACTCQAEPPANPLGHLVAGVIAEAHGTCWGLGLSLFGDLLRKAGMSPKATRAALVRLYFTEAHLLGELIRADHLGREIREAVPEVADQWQGPPEAVVFGIPGTVWEAMCHDAGPEKTQELRAKMTAEPGAHAGVIFSLPKEARR